MSRTRKFMYNSFSAALLQVTTIIIGFITPRVMLEAYGSEINGLLSSVSQFLSYFMLVEAGLAGAAINSLYGPLAKRDMGAVSSIVSAARQFYEKAGFLFVALVVGLSAVYPFFVHTDSLSPFHVGLLIFILGMNGTIDFFTISKYRVLLTADQRVYILSIFSMVTSVINMGLIVLLAHFKINIALLRAAALSTVFLRAGLLWLYARRRYRAVDYHAKPDRHALRKRWDAFYLQIMWAVYGGTPVVLATVLTDLKTVSVYAVFSLIIGGLNGVLNIFISGLSASFGELLVRKEIKTLQKSYGEFEFSYDMLVAFVYSVASVTMMSFVRLYTRGIHDANYDLPLIGFLLILDGLLMNLKTPPSTMVVAAGMFRETRVQTTVQGAILIFFGTILGYFFGLAGILMGSILSNAYRAVDLLIFTPRRITYLPVRQSAKRMIRVFLCFGLVCLPFWQATFSPQNYAQWVLFALCASAWAAVVIGAVNLLLDREECRHILRRLRRVFGSSAA